MDPRGTSAEERIERIERMLEELLARERPRFAECQFLSKYAAARRLGIRTEEVDRLIEEGHLRAVPHGKREVIPVAQLSKFDETGIPPPGIPAGRAPKKPKAPKETARTPTEEARAIREIKIPRDS